MSRHEHELVRGFDVARELEVETCMVSGCMYQVTRGATIIRRQPPEREVTKETVQHLIDGGASADLIAYARGFVDSPRWSVTSSDLWALLRIACSLVAAVAMAVSLIAAAVALSEAADPMESVIVWRAAATSFAALVLADHLKDVE